jgi:hypothetical protein
VGVLRIVCYNLQLGILFAFVVIGHWCVVLSIVFCFWFHDMFVGFSDSEMEFALLPGFDVQEVPRAYAKRIREVRVIFYNS